MVAAAVMLFIEQEGTDMQVTDPVCGMPLEIGKAAANEVWQGQKYYFCSGSCHDKFRAAPDRYAGKGGDKGKPAGSSAR
ncbi:MULTISPECIES: YHS domain-containing protein [Paraburkholderia]|uniref:YHS domain-containing protein n=1 Tax=Paraburkholderia TaxID=1822464 RepID=UPI0038BA1543